VALRLADDDGGADDGIACWVIGDDWTSPAASSRATAFAAVEQALSLPAVSTALTATK
jgi:hypothetical protein